MSSKYLSTYHVTYLVEYLSTFFFCRSKNFQPAPTMILMEILSGPLCRGRFEVPSKYVAISAICLRENRLHLRSGGCNTSRGKHHRGDCLSMAREHKRAIVALCCFHHFDIQKSHGFDPQSQSFPKATECYGSDSRMIHRPLVSIHTVRSSMGIQHLQNQSGLFNCYMPCGQKTTEELKYVEVEDFFLLT